jgi:predicted permease
MYQAIANAAFLILAGVCWRRLRPFGTDADQMRRSLTSLVYGFLLPALVLLVLWRAPLGLEVLQVALVAASCVLGGLVLAWLWFRLRNTSSRVMGTVLLAAGWGNFTYLGLPVLEGTLGEWARSVAIQFDLFAATPLLLTLGILLATRFGGTAAPRGLIRELVMVPPIWAAAAGVVLNLAGVAMGKWVEQLLEMLATGVVPLMLFSTGLALCWASGFMEKIRIVVPVLLIRLLLIPLVVLGLTRLLGMEGPLRTAVVLEAAMPSMVLGLVLCDRFGLDTHLYAEIVVLTTALAVVTLPLWFLWLGG